MFSCRFSCLRERGNTEEKIASLCGMRISEKKRERKKKKSIARPPAAWRATNQRNCRDRCQRHWDSPRRDNECKRLETFQEFDRSRVQFIWHSNHRVLPNNAFPTPYFNRTLRNSRELRLKNCTYVHISPFSAFSPVRSLARQQLFSLS